MYLMPPTSPLRARNLSAIAARRLRLGAENVSDRVPEWAPDMPPPNGGPVIECEYAAPPMGFRWLHQPTKQNPCNAILVPTGGPTEDTLGPSVTPAPTISTLPTGSSVSAVAPTVLPAASPATLVQIAPTPSGYQDVLNWLTARTLFEPIPNWLIALGAGLLIMRAGSSGGRARNPRHMRRGRR